MRKRALKRQIERLQDALRERDEAEDRREREAVEARMKVVEAVASAGRATVNGEPFRVVRWEGEFNGAEPRFAITLDLG